MTLRQAIAPLVDFAFPPRCPSCGEAVLGSASDLDEGLCGECWGKLQLPGQPACRLCQVPLSSDQLTTEGLCGPCRTERPEHDGIAAATIYGPVSRELLLALKHAGRFALAGSMGRFLALRFAAAGLANPENPLVVPVPLHPSRLWKRGYNQSVLLGKSFAARMGWDFQPDVLRRRKRTPSLDGLDRMERRAVLEGAIEPVRRDAVTGRDIVLIDDVVTSGATSGACVEALRSAGARRVIIACYARVALAERHESFAEEPPE
ncbi:ComF family protein [Croceicoccus marinus]|jgi:ComF family protein|uniref:ComF family protein n=1 Tax=Croceicoccus marinus TaxID=450378 RepID=A0A7G6VR39_9SPHN|nr:ComF family protein [Croceicoccus marinus]QNE04204.1 ComF family protein [Croceicoccus marinus]